MTVKPRQIFNLLPKVSAPVEIEMPHGPYADEAGMGITLLETFLLIAMARKVQARRIFEFGTHQGSTTRALAVNFPEADIITMDLKPCQRLPHNVFQRVGDSRTVTLPRIHTRFDLIFVDGDHAEETFLNDTRLAHRILAPGGIIVWHDCGNPEFPHIEEFLEDRAIRIESTMLAVEGLKIP